MCNNIFTEVKQQLNIRQVIEHYGFKVNRNGKFICAFHNDHKPSASIKNDYFNCFVCGAGGDLITFTAKYLGLSNLEAAKELIKVFNLNIDISTKEELRAEYEAERKRKAEIKSCNNLRDKFAKDKGIRANARKHKVYKLRNEVKQINKRAEQERDEYIRDVGFILADMHSYLLEGIKMYPFEHKRHIRGLQELTTCEFYLDCYDSNALEFCKNYKGVIEKYERELNSADKS